MPTPKKSSKPAKAKTESKPAKAAEAPAHQIDLSHSASSVAAAFAMRAKQGPAAAASATGDSHAFKKLKDGLNKPQFSAGSPLAGHGQTNKFNGPSGFAKQTGHNQTAGHNLARTGVPRRTNGS